MPATSGSQELVPSCRVKVNGSPLPPAAADDLLAVTVEQDVDAPGMFVFELVNWDAKKRTVTWGDDDLFSAGRQVVVEMGYVNRLVPLIEGEITGLEPDFAAREIPRLRVRGLDLRHRLLRGTRTRTFLNMKDSAIVQKIAGENNVKVRVKDSGVVHEYVLQHNQTDMAFLRQRARRIGYELTVDGSTLAFEPRGHNATKTLSLERHQDLLAFRPRLSTLGQAGKVEVRGWDPKAAQEILAAAATVTAMGGEAAPAAADKAFGKSVAPQARSDMNVAGHLDDPVFTKAEADKMARALLDERALSYVTGDGETVGRTDLKAGTVVEIDGVGKRFRGPYYVVSTRHTYAPRRGYRTAFTVRRNAS